LIISVNPAEGTTGAGACTGCHWNLLPPPLTAVAARQSMQGDRVAVSRLQTGIATTAAATGAFFGAKWQLQLLLVDWIGLVD